jgi:hypothetical protein
MRLTNLSGIETIQKNVTASGTPERLSPAYTASTIAFVNNSGTPPTAAARDTITDTALGFVTEGFKAGDVLVITGTVSNNIEVTIYSVAAGTITITEKGRFTDEVAGTAFTLTSKKGIPVSDGVGVVVKAKAANTGVITIGSTSAKALNTNSSYYSNVRLSASQAVTLQVKNLNSIWIDATVSSEGVEVLFEA